MFSTVFLYVCRKELLLLTTAHFVFYLFLFYIYIYIFFDEKNYTFHIKYYLSWPSFWLFRLFIYIISQPTNDPLPPYLFYSLFRCLIFIRCIFFYTHLLFLTSFLHFQTTIVPILHILPTYLLIFAIILYIFSSSSSFLLSAVHFII